MRPGSSMVFVVLLLSSFLLIGVSAGIASFLLTLTSTTVEALPTVMPTFTPPPKVPTPVSIVAPPRYDPVASPGFSSQYDAPPGFPSQYDPAAPPGDQEAGLVIISGTPCRP